MDYDNVFPLFEDNRQHNATKQEIAQSIIQTLGLSEDDPKVAKLLKWHRGSGAGFANALEDNDVKENLRHIKIKTLKARNTGSSSASKTLIDLSFFQSLLWKCTTSLK